MEKFTIILTDEQIRALPSTPIEIIPSPGPGKQIVIIEKTPVSITYVIE